MLEPLFRAPLHGESRSIEYTDALGAEPLAAHAPVAGR